MMRIQFLSVLATLCVSASAFSQTENSFQPFECTEATFGNEYFSLEGRTGLNGPEVLVEKKLLNSVLSSFAFKVSSSRIEGGQVLVVKAVEEVLVGNDYSLLEIRMGNLRGSNPGSATFQQYRINEKVGAPLKLDLFCRLK